ncbi:hypothetical protein QQ44_23260 [Mycolicibacterium setense]|uniref:Fibronectin type-III domain-containing protein n=1 Tax=Mycolicibacterium setense TaxID=431269 RepID=A0ABR4YPE4_9MYCO|nr:hypothetical protein [Mycolicibacterium setense]KHO20825.1 hypothetical protein QQ44_23260 [Mycolicibacterium setense]
MSKFTFGLMTRAVALFALLFALSTPVNVGAAPPEVTASENPVLIAHPHFTSKNIDLTWHLDPFQVATLAVTEGGTSVLNQVVSSPNGEGIVPLNVVYDKIYTATLKDAFGKPLGAPLTITTDKPQIDMPLCAQRCIQSIDVQPHGGWAQFDIQTSKTMVITVEASTTPPDANGKWSDPNVVTSFVGTVIPTNHYAPGLPNLQPNTTYHYVVRAHLQGHEQVKTGKFTTLPRRVAVDFDEVQMIEDTDGPLDGDCDCFFVFGVGDLDPIWYGDSNNKKSIGSGTTAPIDVSAGFTNAPNDLLLGVAGYDDDTDAFEVMTFDCLVGHGAPREGESWKDSWSADGCLQHSGDEITVSLSRQGPPGDPGAVDEQFTEPFTIAVDGVLKYKIRGTYRVSYS